MRLSASLARRLLPRARRYLGMNFLRVLKREAGEGLPGASVNGSLECRQLAEDEVLTFSADAVFELDPKWVSEAFMRGAVCLGALENGRLIAYMWLAYGDTPYAADVWIELDPGLRYSHKSFVRPEYRGRRIIQALHARSDRPELWRGCGASVSFVNADNFASLSALERSGARTVGYAAYAKIFGALIAFRSPGLRRAGIRLCAAPPARIADTMQAWPDRSPRSSA